MSYFRMAVSYKQVSFASKDKLSWLEKHQRESCFHLSNLTSHVKLLSGDGFSVSLPLPLLLASSALLQSVLSSHQCCGSVDISLPSVGGGTLVLVAEIIRRGETSSFDGSINARENLREIEHVLDLLRCSASVAVEGLRTGQPSKASYDRKAKSPDPPLMPSPLHPSPSP